MAISHYAKHRSLPVAAGFETEADRDDYINLSIANNHPWVACGEKEARNAECYHNHYREQLEP